MASLGCNCMWVDCFRCSQVRAWKFSVKKHDKMNDLGLFGFMQESQNWWVWVNNVIILQNIFKKVFYWY